MQRDPAKPAITRVTCTFNLLRLGQITEAQELLSGCYEVPCKAFEVVPAGLVLQLLTRRSLTVAKDRTLFSDPEGTIYRHGLLQDQLANAKIGAPVKPSMDYH